MRKIAKAVSRRVNRLRSHSFTQFTLKLGSRSRARGSYNELESPHGAAITALQAGHTAGSLRLYLRIHLIRQPNSARPQKYL